MKDNEEPTIGDVFEAIKRQVEQSNYKPASIIVAVQDGIRLAGLTHLEVINIVQCDVVVSRDGMRASRIVLDGGIALKIESI